MPEREKTDAELISEKFHNLLGFIYASRPNETVAAVQEYAHECEAAIEAFRKRVTHAGH